MRTGTAISVVAHVAAVTACLLLAGVRPFDPTTAEAISVDIVAPDEAPPPPKEPEKAPETLQLPELNFSEKPQQPEVKAPAAAPPPPSQPTPPSPPPVNQSVASRAITPPQATEQPAPQPVVPTAEPDITERYGTLFSLPDPKSGDGFDATASAPADIAREDAAAMRAHLKTCSILPSSISPSDKVRIVLRVSLLPSGNLAAEPLLIEASASKAGPALMRGAMEALAKCQPYSMLPAERYQQWRMLDLSFTPQDFKRG